jgi:hypothetical protein
MKFGKTYQERENIINERIIKGKTRVKKYAWFPAYMHDTGRYIWLDCYTQTEHYDTIMCRFYESNHEIGENR